MSTLIIHRKNSFINGARSYKIFINEDFVGKVAPGDTKKFEVSAQDLQVYGKLDWCTSPIVSTTLQEGQSKLLEIDANRKYTKIFIGSYIAYCLIGALYFIFGSDSSNRIYGTLGLILLLFITFIFILVIKRKEYLALKVFTPKQ